MDSAGGRPSRLGPVLLILVLAAVGLQAWAWRRLLQRVASGTMRKPRALLLYGVWALAPLVLFIGLFMGAVGIEELTKAAVIPEPLARAALPTAAMLLGIAMLGWGSFLVWCGLVVPRART